MRSERLSLNNKRLTLNTHHSGHLNRFEERRRRQSNLFFFNKLFLKRFSRFAFSFLISRL